MKNKHRSQLESLEGRVVPAAFGIPWADTSLTLSFAEDGTQTQGGKSNLHNALGSSSEEQIQWKRSILSAFQAWAENAGFDIAVVSEDKVKFGSPGRGQSDSRFGDIRIGGASLSNDVLAIANPPDPGLIDSAAGDILINTNYRFNGQPYDLRTVLLHEAGHSLGLDHSSDPASPMFEHYRNTISTLAPSDIKAIQSLYGPRMPDQHEGAAGNDTRATASPIPVPAGYNGATPLVAFADLTTASDADEYWFDVVPNYDDDITVQFQSAGLSLVGASLKVYYIDPKGVVREVGRASSKADAIEGDVLSVEIDKDHHEDDEDDEDDEGDEDDHDDEDNEDDEDDENDFGNPSRRYFVRVESSADAPFRVGQYALSVRFEDIDKVSDDDFERILDRSCRSLDANALAALFRNPKNALLNPDGGANNVISSASPLNLRAVNSFSAKSKITASFENTEDLDVYKVAIPSDRSYSVMMINAWALRGQSVRPQIEVIDQAGNPVSALVLMDGPEGQAFQVSNLKPGETYFLRLRSAVKAAGNYSLTVDLGQKGVSGLQLAQGQLADQAVREHSLFIAEGQLFRFDLSISPPGGLSDAEVEMAIIDASGKIVFKMTAKAGKPARQPGLYLQPGQYRVTFTANKATTPVSFSLSGVQFSDPIGPTVDDPTLEPTHDDDDEFEFPHFASSSNPYYWV